MLSDLSWGRNSECNQSIYCLHIVFVFFFLCFECRNSASENQSIGSYCFFMKDLWHTVREVIQHTVYLLSQLHAYSELTELHIFQQRLPTSDYLYKISYLFNLWSHPTPQGLTCDLSVVWFVWSPLTHMTDISSTTYTLYKMCLYVSSSYCDHERPM